MTLPKDMENQSFALIYSVEDPHLPGPLRGVGAQARDRICSIVVRLVPQLCDGAW